ncbi:MAG: amidase family protein, partial [Saprospiraceae bacterium]|nr:amidase family protein [Saprospiraceae bacterium]
MIQVSGKNYRCLDDIQKGLKGGDLTCVQLVQAYLTEVKATTDLNAYVEVYENEAMTAARGLDERIHTSSAKLGPLFGAVLSVKDVIAQENHHLTAGSRILEGYTSIYTATAVQRLLDADAIIIGRVNCDEFAMGSDNRTSVYGPVRNGEHKEHVPGGSSGGSAVSVQVNTCLASIGSDTGGSVRQPASFCGLIGFKPSYGRISRHGLIAYGSSFDQIGVIGKKLDDVTKIYEVMKGVDDYDATLIDPL